MTAFVRQSSAKPANTLSAIPLLHLCSHRGGRNRREIRFIFHDLLVYNTQCMQW